jgi:integrase
MSKRINNTGSITFHKASNRFMGRVTVGRDINGKLIKKCVYGKTEAEVSQAIIKIQSEVNDNNFFEPSKMTLKQWLKQWFEVYKGNNIKEQTKELYEIIIRTIINPNIGDTQLRNLKPLHIQAFINKLYDFGEGYSTSTIQKVKNILNPAFKMAIVNKLISSNPCEGLQMPKQTQKEVVAFTRDEQSKFEESAKNHPFYEAFIFALDTGVRCGELLALHWNDIDLKNGIVKVSKTLITVHDKKLGKQIVKVQNTPKTQQGNREIPLTLRCISMLKELKKQRLQEGFNDRNIVFCSLAGTYQFPKNFRRAMGIVCKNAKVQSGGVHILRHTFATRLFEEKVQPKVVSKLLGHSKIEVTLNTYTHLVQENTNEAINVLNNLKLVK